MGMMANMGMKAFGSVTNTYNSNGDRITNISELTDKVIDENRESAKAKTDIASASLISAANSQMSTPSLKQPAMQGGNKAVPKTVESPYLSVSVSYTHLTLPTKA